MLFYLYRESFFRIRRDVKVFFCFLRIIFIYCKTVSHLISFTSNFELLLTRGIRLFNKNKALRIFLGLKLSLTQCDFCPVL